MDGGWGMGREEGGRGREEGRDEGREGREGRRERAGKGTRVGYIVVVNSMYSTRNTNKQARGELVWRRDKAAMGSILQGMVCGYGCGCSSSAATTHKGTCRTCLSTQSRGLYLWKDSNPVSQTAISANYESGRQQGGRGVDRGWDKSSEMRI